MSAPGRRVKDCLDPWTGVQIGANGDVAPCCHSLQRVGNVGEETLDAVWEGARLRTFRTLLASSTPLPVCVTCFVRGWKEAPASRGRLRRALLSPLRRLRLDRRAALRPWTGGAAHRRGEPLSLNLALEVGADLRGELVDLYLYLDDPRGARHFVAFTGRWLKVVPEVTALLDRTEALDLEWLEVRGTPPGEWEPGEWRCTAVLTPAGRGLSGEGAPLASATCSFTEEPHVT